MFDATPHFPALAHQPYGKRLAFLDSAASAHKPTSVINALTQALSGPYANIHRGLYFNSAETTAAFESARATLATFFGARAEELVFTRNSTESINLVAQSWGRANLTAADTIVLTEAEHHANIVPWQLLQAELGFTIKVLPLALLVNPSNDALAPYFQGAKLLAITAMSNVTGLKPDLATILPAAKAHGLTTLLDASQSVVHGPLSLGTAPHPTPNAPNPTPDTRYPTPDFLVCTAHKLYGPNGIGLLWARSETLNAMPPYQGGGDMIDTVSLPLGTTYATGNARFEAGTPAIAEAIAFAAAADFVTSLGWEAITAHEAALAEELTQTLSELPFLKVYSPANTGIAAFNIVGAHASDVATLLDQQGVAVRSGHHCAMPYLKALGTEGCLRASLALYSTRRDIAQLAEALHKAAKILL